MSGARRPRKIVLVANDVGGLGGMERQLAKLVRGLIGRGWHVTVIARTCSIAESPALRFLRVRGPARPFALAYPTFFVVASWLARRRGDAVLHTTGAIIVNRADCSTVHYCHRAAAQVLTTPRAKRSNALYRLNASVATWMSQLGERWCYRPGRVRALCAVSVGLAAELRQSFPNVARVVHVVANGVDAAAFSLNADARRDTREAIGLAEPDLLALFVGGDWDRKGLRHAIDALPLSPGWRLAVAGTGDRAKMLARASAAGIADRVTFLGAVADMAPVYAAADAFVLPTEYETFSLVTYEAAAAALPLLVSRVHGVEDILVAGVNGWFIDQDPGSIARRLHELGADRTAAGRMGDRAQAAAGDFSWDSMAASYVEVYRGLEGG